MSIKEKSADWIQPTSYLNLFYQKLIKYVPRTQKYF